MSIKVPVILETKTEAIISEFTEKSIVLDFLRRKFGWTELTQLHEGEVIEEEMVHTSHSFCLTRTKRPATPRDFFVDKLIQAVQYDKYTDETFFAANTKGPASQAIHSRTQRAD